MSAQTFQLRGTRVTLAAALGLLLVLGSPVMAETTLRLVPHADLKNLDPVWTTAYITRNHGYMIYDVLFAVNDKLEPQPQMIDSWTLSPDKKTYTFTLREGMRWHDGKPVRAADAVASILRWNEKDTMGQRLKKVIVEFRAMNDRTFVLKLSEPFGLLLDGWSKITSYVPFIMPERMAKTDPSKQVEEHIGSGPFKFKAEEWVPGSKVVYEKFADYKPRPEPASWASGGKVVRVDRAEWLYIPDPSTAAAALQRGEVDWYEVPPVDIVPLLERDPNIQVIVADTLGTVGNMRPNTLHPPFNNPKARQALLWMVNQEDYMRALIGDPKYWRVCAAYFVCGTPLASEEGAEPLLKQDLDKARQLMKEAGYKGEPVVLMDPTDIPVLHAASLVTAQMLRKIGVTVEVQAMDWSTLTSRRAEKKPPAEGGWNLFHTYTNAAGAFTPLTNNQVDTSCDKAWFGWPCDPRVADLIDQYARAGDFAHQKAIAVKIQKLMMEVVPYVQYGQWTPPTAFRKSLQGVIPAPVPFLWNVSKQ